MKMKNPMLVVTDIQNYVRSIVIGISGQEVIMLGQ